jgi:hypothetical protein
MKTPKSQSNAVDVKPQRASFSLQRKRKLIELMIDQVMNSRNAG